MSHLTPCRSVLLSREAHLLKQSGGTADCTGWQPAGGRVRAGGTDGTGLCVPLGGSMRPDSGGPAAARRASRARRATGRYREPSRPQRTSQQPQETVWLLLASRKKKENSVFPHLYSIIHLLSKNWQPILKEKENRHFSVRETLMKRSV